MKVTRYNVYNPRLYTDRIVWDRMNNGMNDRPSTSRVVSRLIVGRARRRGCRYWQP